MKEVEKERNRSLNRLPKLSALDQKQFQFDRSLNFLHEFSVGECNRAKGDQKKTTATKNLSCWGVKRQIEEQVRLTDEGNNNLFFFQK